MSIEEITLVFLFIGGIIYAKFISATETPILFVFIGAYVIPVSTFANNFSNLIFLFCWLVGLCMMGLMFDYFLGLAPATMLTLYFVAKYVFIGIYRRDLVFGSTSAARLSNSWFTGVSRTEEILGDKRDMKFQITLVIIAITSLYLGLFN